MSFKIIALEVLKSCESKHSKNLKKNTPYVFYKNYEIKKKEKTETIKLISEDFDLYSKDIKPKINISAIVGKNGSGKSTLVELLIKAINNLFFRYKQEHQNRNFHSVDCVKGIAVNIYYKTNEGLFKVYVLSHQEKELSIYKVYKYSFDDFSKEYKDALEISSSFDLRDFFYTEVINYSLYAYNSKMEEDNWIKHVFHKNDAYQTPIVLNPYREDGNIDINKENDLVFQRLLANLLKYDSDKNLNLNLGDNLKAHLLVLNLSNSAYYEYKAFEDFEIDLSEFDEDYRKQILDSLLDEFYGKGQEIKVYDEKILKLSKLYIIYKLISICHKYEEYKGDQYFKKGKFINLHKLIAKLNKDTSHITFKLRQMLNYLVYEHVKFDSRKINKFEFKNIAKEIEKVMVIEGCDIINCLPPPIFRTDIDLNSIKSGEKDIQFSTLSSGEKQQIYSTSSIYYHLLNLDSVKNSTDDEKISYRYINIILEEIELYFHPEYQRTYIANLIEGIEKLNLKNIEAINLIFVTHSPFILSDIPSCNVMFLSLNSDGLSKSSEENKKTFAANIHHLLGDNFFFENNIFIGQLAHHKITEIIEFINNDVDNEEDIEYYYILVELIDEPILKNKLLEMFFERYPILKKRLDVEDKKNLVLKYAKDLGIKNVNFN